jgi:hypothetical protein
MASDSPTTTQGDYIWVDLGTDLGVTRRVLEHLMQDRCLVHGHGANLQKIMQYLRDRSSALQADQRRLAKIPRVPGYTSYSLWIKTTQEIEDHPDVIPAEVYLDTWAEYNET